MVIMVKGASMEQSADEVLWTVKDVAVFLEVSERTIWNRLRRAEFSNSRIPRLELDGKPRFLPSQIRQWKVLYGRTLSKRTPQEELRIWQQLSAERTGRTAG